MTPATAENGVCEKVSSPYDVNDLLQVFFEKNQKFFYDWIAFRLESSTDIGAIQRIYDWFKGKPDVLLEFRREVLLFPGVAVPIPYNFDELIWIEAIYGGRIELDVKLLSEVSGDETLSLRMKLGFKKLYGITFDEYLDEFKDAPADVIDILNKRANVTHMYHWTDQHEWHHIRQLFSTR